MKSRVGQIGLVAGLLVLSSAAYAQQAPDPDDAPATETTEPEEAPTPAPAPRAAGRTARNASVVELVNGRTANLTGFSLRAANGKPVVSLKKPLAGGKKASLKLPKGAGCTFTVVAQFADDAPLDATEVDLCTDKTVRFTE